jgi:hypothetical protein
MTHCRDKEVQSRKEHRHKNKQKEEKSKGSEKKDLSWVRSRKMKKGR